LAERDDEVVREASYIVSSAYGETFPAPEALQNAKAIAASNPSISEIVVHLYEDAEWDADWGNLS